MMMRPLVSLCLVMLCAAAHAFTADTPLPSAAQEARAQTLFKELRCAVCQSESLADSPAAVAADMRREVRTRITAGADDGAIKAALVAHYGDAILMRPPFSSATVLLWSGPGIIVTLALLLATNYFRRHPRLVRGSAIGKERAFGSRSPHKAGMTSNNDDDV